MERPSEEKRTYCVYGFWHIDDDKQYVTKDGKIDIQEFSDIDNALTYMKNQVLSNVNITWCITWDKYEIEKIKNI